MGDWAPDDSDEIGPQDPDDSDETGPQGPRQACEQLGFDLHPWSPSQGAWGPAQSSWLTLDLSLAAHTWGLPFPPHWKLGPPTQRVSEGMYGVGGAWCVAGATLSPHFQQQDPQGHMPLPQGMLEGG